MSGDQFVKNFYQILKQAFAQGVKCHEHSDDIWWGADCADLVQKLGPNYEKYLWRYYFLNATQGYLNSFLVNNNS